MTLDQAADLRQLVRAESRMDGPQSPAPRMVVVSGGKGGVGTTTVAVNLAAALAWQGRRTVLVDADLERGTIAALCQVADQGSILDVLDGCRTLHEVLQRGPSGVQVVPGAWASRPTSEVSAAAQQRLIGELKGLGLHADVIVVDAGAARNHFARRFWQAADLVVVAAASDVVALMEAYAAIKVLLASDASIAVCTLVNQAVDAEAAQNVHEKIALACRRFLGLRTFAAGDVPADSAVLRAAESGRPVLLHSPRSEAARAMERLAELLWSRLNREKSELAAEPMAADAALPA